jgi:hypothetical protein
MIIRIAQEIFAGYKTEIAPRIPKSVKKEPQMEADLQSQDKRLNREWTRIDANEELTSARTSLIKIPHFSHSFGVWFLSASICVHFTPENFGAAARLSFRVHSCPFAVDFGSLFLCLSYGNIDY